MVVYYSHEIVGEVSEIGSKVCKFNIGDKVGVGCIVDSCRTCESCLEDQENYCTKAVATYNGLHRDGTVNYGGYSDHVVVEEHYAVKIPHTLPLASAAPLLCAGLNQFCLSKSLLNLLSNFLRRGRVEFPYLKILQM